MKLTQNCYRKIQKFTPKLLNRTKSNRQDPQISTPVKRIQKNERQNTEVESESPSGKIVNNEYSCTQECGKRPDDDMLLCSKCK